jgi:calcineurin-like phosphoesterase family protein
MSNTRNYYFTSDTHFSHRNIIKYTNRPFANADEMNEEIIRNWNRIVTKQDIIYHLGDVAFEKDRDKLVWMLSRLNGEKHLIWGNHDKLLKTIRWQDHFQSAQPMRVIHVPPEATGTGRGQRIVLCHYAMRVWDQSHHGTWQLYGHSHGSLPDDVNMLSCDVGVDSWNFAPVSMAQLNIHMSKKAWKPIDHHGKTWEDEQDDPVTVLNQND